MCNYRYVNNIRTAVNTFSLKHAEISKIFNSISKVDFIDKKEEEDESVLSQSRY